jgi:hypothetical protein
MERAVLGASVRGHHYSCDLGINVPCGRVNREQLMEITHKCKASL